MGNKCSKQDNLRGEGVDRLDSINVASDAMRLQPFLGISDNSYDELDGDEDEMNTFDRGAALTIFCILYQMIPVPSDAWVPRSEYHRCMVCDKALGRMSVSYSHCRKCGMILCKTCSKRRFLFPHIPMGQQKVCAWCFEALSRMDAELERTLQCLPWKCSKRELIRLITEQLSTNVAETGHNQALKTKVKSVNPMDAVRHPAVELFKTTARGAEQAAAKSGAQMFFTGGTASMAAAGSAAVAVPIQLGFSAYEVYKLRKQYARGSLNGDELGWSIAAETSKGVFSVGGAVTGAVIGSVIPGLGTVLGLVVGSCLAALSSFAAGSTAHTTVRVLGNSVIQRRALTRPSMDLLMTLMNSYDVCVQYVGDQLEFITTLRIKPISFGHPLRMRINCFETTVEKLGLQHRRTKAELKRVCELMGAKLNQGTAGGAALVLRKKYCNLQYLMQQYARLLFQFIAIDYCCQDDAIACLTSNLRSLPREQTKLHQDKDYTAVAALFEKASDDVSRAKAHIKQQFDDLSLATSPQNKTQCLQSIVDCCSVLLSSHGITPGAEAVNDALLYCILEFQPKALYANLQFIQETLADRALGKTACDITSVSVVVGSLAYGKIF